MSDPILGILMVLSMIVGGEIVYLWNYVPFGIGVRIANRRTDAMSDDTKLKPCPFCGNNRAELTEAMGEAWVICHFCKASGGASSRAALAALNWNARAKITWG